jgi:Cu/Ag efflux pump CusA
LIFGILVSTVLTLVVIPVLYYTALWRKEPGGEEHPAPAPVRDLGH